MCIFDCNVDGHCSDSSSCAVLAASNDRQGLHLDLGQPDLAEALAMNTTLHTLFVEVHPSILAYAMSFHTYLLNSVQVCYGTLEFFQAVQANSTLRCLSVAKSFIAIDGESYCDWLSGLNLEWLRFSGNLLSASCLESLSHASINELVLSVWVL